MHYVAIDPGHGVNTPGKRSPDSSLLEYKFNQDIAKYLKQELDRHNIKNLITCDGSYDMSLTERANKANNAGCDLFISIHGNAYGETWNNASGWEDYVCAKGGNAEKFAKLLNKYCITDLGLKDRGVKTANFTVLLKTKMPAVLTENGFYTNRSECDRMKTEEFKRNCAIAHAKAICEYYGVKYIEQYNVIQPDDKERNMVDYWAKDAYDWVKKHDISDGKRPKDIATREEIWTLLYNYNNKVK